MIPPEDLLAAAAAEGFELVSGVPCSHLTPMINASINSQRIPYIKAANEGDAVAIGCGADLGGRRAIVMFQNSGLGNAVNPLSSLAYTFELPLLLICTWRGAPEGPPDEPQHELMGRITTSMLELLEIPWRPFPEEPQELPAVFEAAKRHWQSRRTPFAFVVRKGVFSDCALHEPKPARRAECVDAACPQSIHELDSTEVLTTIRECAAADDAVLATTGYTGRALYAVDDRPSNFYMIGSMGCVSSLALGLAVAQPRRRAIAIDGDGAALMRLGAMATVGHYQPPNLLHILLDNGMHESTGGQSTVADSTDFPAIAAACGYQRVVMIDSLSTLRDLVHTPTRQLTFAYVRTARRTNYKLPRPKERAPELALRFREWLTT